MVLLILVCIATQPKLKLINASELKKKKTLTKASLWILQCNQFLSAYFWLIFDFLLLTCRITWIIMRMLNHLNPRRILLCFAGD